jgi:hypothetical protein
MDNLTWIDVFDILVPPFYLMAIYSIAFNVKNRNYLGKKKEHFKYFIPALTFKIIGAIAFCSIYTFYYDGGDATNYFESAETYVNVLYNEGFGAFMEIAMFHKTNVYMTGWFNETNGYLYFGAQDYYALFTVLLTVPICLVAAKSWYATGIILSSLSFIGMWKLYEVFVTNFPRYTKEFAIAILFIPSVIFWGSGILKDTYTLSACGFYTYSVFKFFIEKRRKAKYLLGVIGFSLMLILIKPYIFFALLPGSLIWIYFDKFNNIQSPILKVLSIPLLILTAVFTIFTVLKYFGEYLGEYSLDNVLHKAVKTQQDLVRDQYGANSYDIGQFDASIQGISTKVIPAVNMALFRPYIWDARNPVMLLSGLENLVILLLTIYVIARAGFHKMFIILFGHPLLVFSFLFAIFFAFSVGLTTANYGALVRLKIPCIPFYVATLYMLYIIAEEKRDAKFRKHRSHYKPAGQF